jgi:NADP-dependent aldehyde dehydrogenase
LLAAAAPEGVFTLVHGQHAGTALVTDPRVRAVGFTGSTRGGRTLFDLAASRPEPIPFYGELGSVNPLVITPGAAAERAEEIGQAAAGSVLLGLGQRRLRDPSLAPAGHLPIGSGCPAACRVAGRRSRRAAPPDRRKGRTRLIRTRTLALKGNDGFHEHRAHHAREGAAGGRATRLGRAR